MASTCITSLDLCAIRLAMITEAGAPDPGANNGYVSVAPQTLEVTIEVTAGDEPEMRNGCGALMASFLEPDKIKGVSFSGDFCQLDAYMLEIMTGASVISSGGNAIGFQFPAVGAEPPPVCFEAWSKAWSGDSQVVAPFTDPLATYIHWVFPYTRWVQGAFTMEHDLMIVPVTGKGRENASITANGPFDDWPTAVANAGGITRIGGWFYDDSLPNNDSCTYIEVTSAAS